MLPPREDVESKMFPEIERLIQDNPGWLDEAINEHDAGKIVAKSPKAMGIMRVRGGGPPFLKIGKSVLYRRRDVFAWLAAHRVRSTSGRV